MDKAKLRRHLLQTRRSLHSSDWQQKSRQICDCLQTIPQFIEAQTVLAYFSFRQEPDLTTLFSMEKTWGFSRCVDETLHWHAWSTQDTIPLQAGKFGISEPHPEAPSISPDQVDLILVPAVACDRQGYRLGYGGGFYDRLLSDPTWSAKPTIGIVFDFARVDSLPTDHWDQPLDGVCTEAGYFLT